MPAVQSYPPTRAELRPEERHPEEEHLEERHPEEEHLEEEHLEERHPAAHPAAMPAMAARPVRSAAGTRAPRERNPVTLEAAPLPVANPEPAGQPSASSGAAR
jgi:hypothetical protein